MRLLSQTGQGVFLAGLFLLVGTSSRPAAGTSGILVAMMAAALLGAIPAGSFADRIGPAVAVRLGAAGRALAIGVALLIALEPTTGAPFLLLAGVAFLYSAMSQLYSPAEMALVAPIAGNQASRAHAVLVALQYVGHGMGAAIVAPVVLLIGGVPAALGVALILYAMVSIIAIALSTRLGGVASLGVDRKRYTLGDTLRYFKTEQSAAYAAILLAFAEVSAKAMAVALPVYVARDMALVQAQSVALVVAGASGAVAGLLIAGRRLHVRAPVPMMRLIVAGTVGSMVVLAIAGQVLAGTARVSGLPVPDYLANAREVSFGVAIPVAVLLGLCFAAAPIGARAILSRTAPRGQQARVFAMQATFTDSLVILPLILAGAGVELAGAWTTFVLVAVIGVAVIALLELPRFLGGAVTAAVVPAEGGPPAAVVTSDAS